MPTSVDAFLKKARAAQKRGDHAEMERHYAALLALDPDNMRARKAVEALNAQKPAVAMPGRSSAPSVLSASATAPAAMSAAVSTAMSAAALNDLVRLFHAGRFDQLIVQGSILAQRQPGLVPLYDLLGAACAALQCHEQAASWFSKAIEWMPEKADAHFNLGVTWMALNRVEEAIAAYERAVRLQPDNADIHFNLGIALQAAGRQEEAIRSYRRAVRIRPGLAGAHNNLGNALKALGRRKEAMVAYERALLANPAMVEAHNNMGNAHKDAGRMAEALACYERALVAKPDYVDALSNKGMVLSALGRPEEAVACLKQALALRPDHVDGHYNLGLTLQILGRHEEALAHLEKAVGHAPDNADALCNRGVALHALGRTAEGIACLEQAIRLRPTFATAFSHLANMLKETGRRDEAIACYERAVELEPDSVAAHNNLGVILLDAGRLEEASARFAKGIEVAPDNLELQNNLGTTLQQRGLLKEAIGCYQKALEINPDSAEAHYNLGNILKDGGHLAAAIECFENALALKPDKAACRSAKLHHQAHICDWDAMQEDVGAIAALGVGDAAVAPFTLLSLEDCPQRHRIRSEKFAREMLPAAPRPLFARPASRPERLRIGYFSADFHNHATMFLMARMFEVHDPRRFALHAFSYGPRSDDEMRRRLVRAVDVFHDVRAMSDADIAALARGQGIDIAVDLKGYTYQARMGVAAHHPAPIQISYLGYPGTLGADFIDYIVGDPVVIPPEQRAHYTESVIFLPDSYQINDNSRVISDRPVTRAGQGLPETGFIFCCFNNSYKISAEEFDIWMRLLHRVEGSVLWLLKTNEWAEENLRKHAERRGIAPERLVFAAKMPQAEHLARLRLADLFVDTFHYNAHTTASDALWAGVPVVTRAGQGFSARVAASLLSAAGLPQLITTSSSDYERLALHLAENRPELDALRQDLDRRKATMPLFDSERFTRHMEAAYDAVYDRYLTGQPFEDVVVQP